MPLAGSPKSGAPSPRGRRRLLVSTLALALLLVGGALATDRLAPSPNPESSPPVPVAGVGRIAVSSATGGGAGGARDAEAAAAAAAAEAPEGEVPRAVWRQRLDRARFTLRSYLESTRYPPSSRPIDEHPDQAELAAPERTMPLDADDPDDPEGVLVTARQSRVFVAGGESVTFEVACEDDEALPVPCEVESYSEWAEHYGPGSPRVPLAFTADGSGARWTAVFTPARDGFAGVEGTLRTWAQVSARGDRRALFFDIVFTPRPPARFTGRVHERLEAGSLVLGLELEVREPGIYVGRGRIDDASGEPQAMVTFTEELGAGLRVAPLVVFGKLVRDYTPLFPLTLRDVEAFRLREEGDPDRELLPTLAGRVHATRVYPLDVFSDAEWQSEERERYTRELTKDVEEAAAEAGAPP